MRYRLSCVGNGRPGGDARESLGSRDSLGRSLVESCDRGSVIEPSEKSGALVLVSGGLDSAVTALVAKSLSYRLHGLTFSYGQRHTVEVDRARLLGIDFEFVEHRVVELAPFPAGSSALTDPNIEVPKNRAESELQGGPIPETYVPARNTIFLTHALAMCEVWGLHDIFIGVNALDYSGYPDCRPEYLRAFEDLAQLATRVGVEGRTCFRVRAPLLHRSKAEIVRLGTELGLDFSRTWSCYDPVVTNDGAEFLACGTCDSCQLRLKGFHEAGVLDPLRYA